jgi:hypothetical protein
MWAVEACVVLLNAETERCTERDRERERRERETEREKKIGRPHLF